MYLFIDTETNGLPNNYDNSLFDLDNWPRVAQIAWAVYDEKGRCIKERSTLIKPDGWTVPKTEFFKRNNMKDLLEKLTKEDLIKVVANMHDTIQEWNNGYGLPKEEAEILIKIGSACTSACSEMQDWNLPQVQ